MKKQTRDSSSKQIKKNEREKHCHGSDIDLKRRKLQRLERGLY